MYRELWYLPPWPRAPSPTRTSLRPALTARGPLPHLLGRPRLPLAAVVDVSSAGVAVAPALGVARGVSTCPDGVVAMFTVVWRLAMARLAESPWALWPPFLGWPSGAKPAPSPLACLPSAFGKRASASSACNVFRSPRVHLVSQAFFPFDVEAYQKLLHVRSDVELPV